MKISSLPTGFREPLEKYFKYPYGGTIFIYNNTVNISDFEQLTFHEILSRPTVDGKPSIALSIHEAIIGFIEREPYGLKSLKVLDVGCKIGYFSFLMAESGARTVVGVDHESLPIQVAEAIQRLRGINLNTMCFVAYPIEDYVKGLNRFDLTLMLNVFDHLLRYSEEMAWATLKRISEVSRCMALSMGPHARSPHRRGVTITDENIEKEIKDHSTYSNATILLHNSYGGRNLWMFWR